MYQICSKTKTTEVCSCFCRSWMVIRWCCFGWQQTLKNLLCAKAAILRHVLKTLLGNRKAHATPPPCPTVARLNYSFRKARVSSPIQQLHPRNLDTQTDAIFEAGGTFPKPIIFGTYSLTFLGGQGNSSYVHHCSIANLLYKWKTTPPFPKNRSFPKERRFGFSLHFSPLKRIYHFKKAGDVNLHDHQQLDQTIRFSSLFFLNKGRGTPGWAGRPCCVSLGRRWRSTHRPRLRTRCKGVKKNFKSSRHLSWENTSTF